MSDYKCPVCGNTQNEQISPTRCKCTRCGILFDVIPSAPAPVIEPETSDPEQVASSDKPYVTHGRFWLGDTEYTRESIGDIIRERKGERIYKESYLRSYKIRKTSIRILLGAIIAAVLCLALAFMFDSLEYSGLNEYGDWEYGDWEYGDWEYGDLEVVRYDNFIAISSVLSIISAITFIVFLFIYKKHNKNITATWLSI